MVVRTNSEHEKIEEDVVGESSPPRGHKKRKRSAAADEIDALFENVIGRKVVRSALELAATPPLSKSKTKEQEGGGQAGTDRHTDLGAIAEAIKDAPRGEQKKRRKRQLG